MSAAMDHWWPLTVDGVTITYGPLWLPFPDGPAVRVGYASGVATIAGLREHPRVSVVRVPADVAGDLSWRPWVAVVPSAGNWSGTTHWEVCALGFIEQEAEQACVAVAAALRERLAAA